MAHSKKHREAISRGLKAYHKGKSGRRKRSYERKYSPSERRAHVKSRTSKSGHKSWRERQKSSKPGLWSNVWAKRKREGKKK